MSTTNNIAGYQLSEGVSYADLEHWPEFAEWATGRGYEVDPEDHRIKELFEAYLEGGCREFLKQLK